MFIGETWSWQKLNINYGCKLSFGFIMWICDFEFNKTLNGCLMELGALVEESLIFSPFYESRGCLGAHL